MKRKTPPLLRRIFALAVAGACLTPVAQVSADTIALIGNTLPERFQHDGWLVTLAQREFKGENLSFRNLASGHTRAMKCGQWVHKNLE